MNLETTYIPDSARRVLIALNPKAGSRSGRHHVEQLAELLNEEGFAAEILTDIDEIATESAAAMGRDELRAVVAAGGDGTVCLVANRTLPGVPITVLPLGTENLLSKYLGVSTDPKSVCRMIAQGATLALDVGAVDDRLFLLMVCCGFDADVVQRVHEGRKGHIRHLSYAKPILDSIRNYQYPELRLYCDGDHMITARWGFVFNLPCYALGLRIAPDAIGTDGLLDVCTFKQGSLWNGLRYLSGVVFGRHKSWSDCVMQKTQRVRIESDQQVPYSIDGDPGGFLPVEIEVLPNRLTLLVPESWAAKQNKQLAQKTT